ncbi:hypothetical protein NLG97_g1766 [Lecanicillium saksenae]|uniref:Uncharacterized protein n=1 Tax=Lecanicillium saksenae TaxID=468837 RepID=A0ACC1R433_9HYPO|nr:hypothetical protein NLG97_g1766 [Lecanicillium saksenae]
MSINTGQVYKGVKTAYDVAKGGVTLDLKDSNAPYQYAVTILAAGAGLVPEVGPMLSSVILLIGAIAFPPKKDPKEVWNLLRADVEELIGVKVDAERVKSLEATIEGFKTNMKSFSDTFNSYDAASDERKPKLAEPLRTVHTAFLYVLQTSMPQFEIENIGVATLGMFTLAANMHITLLADGIKSGEKWGWPREYITNTLQPQFDEVTVGSSPRARGLHSRDTSSDVSLLQDCIRYGEAAGFDAALLDTWKTALGILSNASNSSSIFTRGVKMTYPAHAKLYYEKGRAMVKPYTAGIYNGMLGTKEALKLNALADYDMTMYMNVLALADFWPYQAGAPMTESARLALDREIFSGPYGRYTDGASWSAKSPPPVTPRAGNITAIQVRSFEDIDMLRVRYGEEWGTLLGSGGNGDEVTVNLAFDVYIKAVDINYGAKLGQLTFFSNQNKTYGPLGQARHSQNTTFVQHDGFKLSSMYVTNWEKHPPTGCEGIILGFRPLIMN